MFLKDNFRQQVLQTVNAIPYGKVTTYGEVAKIAGSPRAARQVGGILKKLPNSSALPWHRVVNRYGRISLQGEDYLKQYQALIKEGIVFSENQQIDLQQFAWQISQIN